MTRAAAMAAVAFVASLLLAATTSHGGETVDVNRCTIGAAPGEPAPSATVAIKECSQMIRSRRFAGAELATLYLQRGEIYLAMRRPDPAIADFSRAIDLKPDLVDAYRNRAEAHFQKREIERAADDYTRAMSLAPKDVSLVYSRGQLYYHAGDCRRALDDYTAAIALKPIAQFFAERALCYGLTGDNGLELADYEHAAELEPDNFAYPSSVCGLMLRVRSAEETIAKCSAVIARWPHSAVAFDMRGLARIKLGEFREAIADFDAALALIPNEPIALFGRGVAKLRSGDAAGGQADIDAAKALAPHIAEAVGNFGIAP
jgi:tetratricopeptide (TPR) repeat protein